MPSPHFILVTSANSVAGFIFEYLASASLRLYGAEIAVLPLTFGLWAYALAFSALNALILFVRIRAEAAALKEAESA